MKNFKKIIQLVLKKTTEIVNPYSRLSILFYILLLLIAGYEIIASQISKVEEIPFVALAGTIIINYTFYWLKTFVFLLFPYSLFFIFSKKSANIFYIITAIILLLLQLALIQYFNKSLVPLGADLFAYSMADIKQTLGASGGISMLQIAAFIFLISFSAWVFIRFSQKITIRKIVVLPVICTAVFITATGFSFSTSRELKTEYSRSLVINKSNFFIAQSYQYFFPETIENDIYSDSYSGDFGTDMPKVKDFMYVDEARFPFLHKDETPDVLSTYFNTGKQKPNIVIIFVEGLGRAFTNEGAALGNFTPFIDSLSHQSLYWNNFLSSAGRSFGVLPSVLGSLPFAKNGFNELGDKMPPHLSLISLARHNGYKTAFFYGGDSRFDNMNLFLKKNGIDNIYDEFTFPDGYSKLPAHNGFTWGYGDAELFRRYMQLEPDAHDKPVLNVLFTIATHSPFLLNNQEKYNQMFVQRMDQLKFSDEKKAAYRQYEPQYASVLFLDEAMRNFINNYQKRSDFENTIFIITGDHRMPEIPMLTKIDRYHVPLIIYSPLLKRTATFSSISCHFDITPSLVAFLHNSYSFEKPTLESWMGSGLDTTRTFSNEHHYPLMQTKNDVIDFVQGTSHLNGNTAYSVGTGMTEDLSNDKEKTNQLMDGFNRFKVRNEKLIQGAGLIPDSIYQKFFYH